MARLTGILVVSLEQAVAAPLCSCRLADAGARVIKIERAEGDFARGYDAAVHGESSYFVWLNRGKESVVLDLKAEGDKALLRRLIARADVFVQNLIPGAAARAGFDPQELRRRHPRLVTCSISGYGDSGPYSERKAYDLLIQAESGLASVTGSPEAPGRVGVSLSDIVCGLNAHAAILEALYRRERTGEGAGISVSLFDATAEAMAVPLLQHDYGGRAPRRLGLAHPSIAPYGVFETADGRPLLIAIQNEREWRAFCAAVLQQPALADDPRFVSNNQRVANRSALDGAIADVCRGHAYAALVALLQAAGIAFGAVNDVAGLGAHPHLRRRTVATPSGEASLPAPPARFAGDEPAPSAVPALGQHTDAVRREFAP
ncbi:MAG TPA: CaiB/BaiF CoA-transferase family protein [Candidatus Acidoferrum sp.]|nr:CaiB/BaiF CoA-transferase family protein [Candidatus Acidoferrum sp.]